MKKDDIRQVSRYKSLKTDDRHKTGSRGEDLAAEYYKSEGYFVAARNYYSRFGEIDLIVEDEKTVVFVEVKVRQKNAGYLPREAVTNAKINKIKNTAKNYLFKSRLYSLLQPRFDVAEIIVDGNGFENAEINIIKNAF